MAVSTKPRPKNDRSQALALRQARAALTDTPEVVSVTVQAAPISRNDPRVKVVQRSQLLRSSAYGRSDLDANDPEILEMRLSIRQEGVMVPGIARPNPRYVKGGLGYSMYPYELIAGYKRDFCCELEGIPELPLAIWEMDDVEAASVSLQENLQRSDPSPVELGLKFMHLRETMRAQFDTFVQAAAQIAPKGRTRASGLVRQMNDAQYQAFIAQFNMPQWAEAIMERARANNELAEVTNMDVARMVNLAPRTIMQKMVIAQLPEDVREKLTAGRIVETEARMLTSLKEPGQQSRLAREISRRRSTGNPMAPEEIRERVRLIAGARAVAQDDGAALTLALGGETSNVVEGEVVENTPAASNGSGTSSGGSSSGGAAPAPGGGFVFSGGGGWSSAATVDPTLAVGAVTSVISTNLRDAGRAIHANLSSARMALEALPEAERAAFYKQKVLPQIKRARKAHDQWWDSIEAGFTELAGVAGVDEA